MREYSLRYWNMRKRLIVKATGSTLVAALLVVAGGTYGQSDGLTRTLVGRADVSVPGREAVVARVEVAPGAVAGRHVHPGDEISYVLEGETEVLIDGQPPRVVKAGESFVIPQALPTTRVIRPTRR